jgi:large subunit ribosomal protein L15
VVKHDPTYWLKKGFVSARALGKKVNIINIGKLDDLADMLESEKKLEKKDKKIFLDLESLGFDKLLGTGNISKPMVVKVASYSETASRKLEEAGGEILKEAEA